MTAIGKVIFMTAIGKMMFYCDRTTPECQNTAEMATTSHEYTKCTQYNLTVLLCPHILYSINNLEFLTNASR